MNLTETPEYITWPETHYVFVERVGPFMKNAPEAWGEAHGRLAALMESSQINGYMSLYKPEAQVYRAGFAVESEPDQVPDGLRYERFPGGKYARFILTGPYNHLPEATGRVFEQVAEQKIPVRDDFFIENYVNDPRKTPAEELVTQIHVPTN
jgi:predicted transcriptional regulator YdeE